MKAWCVWGVLYAVVMGTSYMTGHNIRALAKAEGFECNLTAIFTCGLAKARHEREMQELNTFAFRV